MRFCKHPGCPNLVTSGYCEQHSQSGRLCLEPHCPNKAVYRGYCEEHDPRKAWSRESDKHRGNSVERGYDHNWNKASKQYLASHPICERCESMGRITPAVMVHHKRRIAEGGAVYDTENLEALCWKCHHETHRSEGLWRKKHPSNTDE